MHIKAETLHDEAALLKELFAKHSKLSLKDFAKTFDIGTPALLWQYLNGRKALGLKAAIKIATDLEDRLLALTVGLTLFALMVIGFIYRKPLILGLIDAADRITK